MSKLLRMFIKHGLFIIAHIYYVFLNTIPISKKNGEIVEFFNEKNYKEYIQDLDRNGYVVIENFFDKNKVEEMHKDFLHELQNNKKKFFAYINKSKVNIQTLENKSESYKNKVSYAIYGGENKNSSILFDIITKHEIFEKKNTLFLQNIIGNYLNYSPKITSGNLRISFSNNLPASETQLFHRDGSGYKFLKIFSYLHDVELDNGPFTFVKKSHKDKFKFKDEITLRHTESEIINKYKKESIIFLNAKKTDLIIADTSGFHRGTKNIKDRTMLTINFHAHAEVFRNPELKVDQSVYNKMREIWGKNYIKYLKI